MGALLFLYGRRFAKWGRRALRDLSLKQAYEYATQVYSFWRVLYYEKILTYKDKLLLRMLNEKNEKIPSFQTFL